MSVRAWLRSEPPSGTTQAVVQQAWRGWRRFARHPLGLLGLGVILLLVLTAAMAPWLTHYDPAAQAMLERLQPPSTTHLLGTDEFGRDVSHASCTARVRRCT